MKKHNQELDIDEDIKLESRNWAVERMAWVLMAVVVLAALLGFTGNGGIEGLTEFKQGSEAKGIELAYERYLRRYGYTELQVTLYPQGSSPYYELHFNKHFQEKLHVEQVVPEPTTVYTHADGITYRFESKDSPSHVIFYIKPKHIGNLDLTVASQGTRLAFSQFVYP